MPDTKLTGLTALTTPLSTDISYVVGDPSGSPVSKKSLLSDIIQKAHGLGNGMLKTAAGIMGVATDGTDYLSPSTGDKMLTPVATKTANYTANANEFVPCSLTGSSFAVTLPTAPANGSRVRIQLTPGTNKVLEVKTGGADTFFAPGGPTVVHMYIYGETQEFQYQSSGAFWNGITMASTSNFANNNPGIDAITPITNADISIDTSTRVLTITPPLQDVDGTRFFNIFVDGGGKTTRIRKTGIINFPAFTDTSGPWYFYFNSSGTPVTTQTPWATEDFPNIATVYRIHWNASLVGAAKLVAQYIEYHVNDIPADVHQWMHLYGAVWGGEATTNFAAVTNTLISGAPNADGRNTVISLTTGHNIDDNLEYTVTNSVAGTPWTQDMGNTTPASLNSTNSGLFKIYTQDAGGLLSFLPATRFPFPWDSGTNVPQYITSTGTRTPITNGNFMTVFIYATQNPTPGDAIKVVTATQQFTSLTNARAYNWVDIQNAYSILGLDGEIRPMYRLIFEVHTGAPAAYDIACKYSVLREVQDIRKTQVASSTAISGSLPASSVTVVPAGNIASTNTQAALEELDAEKVAKAGDTMTGALVIEPTSSLTLGKASTNIGSMLFKNASNTNTLTIQSGDTAVDHTWTLPTAQGGASTFLQNNGSGVLSWAAASGFSWGSSITGTSGIGVLNTLGANSSVGTIGESIVVDNTQANAVTLLNLDAGTSAFTHVCLKTASPNGTCIYLNNTTTTATGSNNLAGILNSSTFNTSSSNTYHNIWFILGDNSGSGGNNGIFIRNLSTTATLSTGGSYPTGKKFGLMLTQNGVDGTSMIVYGGNNVNSTTNGLVNYTLMNTQSGASVVQKIDLGTSAQGHTGLQILAKGASASQKGITVDIGTTGTGIGYEFITGSGSGGNLSAAIKVTLTTSGTGYSGRIFDVNDSNGYLLYNHNQPIFNSNFNQYSSASGGTARTTDPFLFKYTEYDSNAFTTSSSFNNFSIIRYSYTANAGASKTISGSVLSVEDKINQATGTLIDTIDVVKLIQSSTITTGKLITGVVGSTERFKVHPVVSDGSSAVAYLHDTTTALSTFGAKIATFSVAGTQKFAIDIDGETYTGVYPSEGKQTLNTIFETAARFSNTTSGGGAITYDNTGVNIKSSTTSGGYAKSLLYSYGIYNGYNSKPVVCVGINCSSLDVANGSGQFYVGIGNITTAAGSLTFTDTHVGYKIVKTGGTVSLYGTVATGGSETATAALTTLVDSDVLELYFRINSSSNVSFWYTKNGVTSAITAVTTNIPTGGGGSTILQLAVTNQNTGNDFQFIASQMSYVRGGF